jgi:hypothetical protein
MRRCCLRNSRQVHQSAVKIFSCQARSAWRGGHIRPEPVESEMRQERFLSCDNQYLNMRSLRIGQRIFVCHRRGFRPLRRHLDGVNISRFGQWESGKEQ